MGVFKVFYQRNSGLKRCICLFRNKHRNEQPEPGFLPPKTKEHWWILLTAVKTSPTLFPIEVTHSTWLQCNLITLGLEVQLNVAVGEAGVFLSLKTDCRHQLIFHC